MFFQAENSSTTCSVRSSTRHASPERLPDALRPGQPVFVKFPYSAKFADKGRSGVVSRHINPRTVRVHLSDGSYVDAAVHRISLLPWDYDSSSGRGAWPDAGSDAAESQGDSLPCLPLPCSQPHGSSSLSAASSSSSDGADMLNASPTLPRRSSRRRRPPVRLGNDEAFG